MKRAFLSLLVVLSGLVLQACGGGGGGGERTGVLTVQVDPVVLESNSDVSGADSVSLTLTYSQRDTLEVLPLQIYDAEITYTRLDCTGCPTLPARTVPLNLYMKGGESQVIDLPLILADDKVRLPVAGTKTVNNPLLGSATEFVTKSEFVGHLSAIIPAVYGQAQSEMSHNSETVGTGDGVTTDFYYVVGYQPVQKTVEVYIDDAIAGYDRDGDGVLYDLQGGQIGSVDYEARRVVLNFGTPPADGAVIEVRYGFYPEVTDSPNVSFTMDSDVSPGSVFVMIGSEVVASDNGVGDVVPVAGAAYSVTGSVSYSSGTGTLHIQPVPQPAEGEQAVPVVVYYVKIVRSVLSYPPVVAGSVSVSVGTQEGVCKDDGSGRFQPPCFGAIDYAFATLSGFGMDGTLVDSPGSIYIVYDSYTESFGGDVLVEYADGITQSYTFFLRYPPVAPPMDLQSGEKVYLKIKTDDGLVVRDTGDRLVGDVCPEEVSEVVDRTTGQVYVCFVRPPSEGSKIVAYYMTYGMRLRADIEVRGKEVEGRDVSVTVPVEVVVYGNY